MDRIWRWTWDRYGARYSWACCVITLPLALPVYLAWAMCIIAFEQSDRYLAAAALTVASMPVYLYAVIRPGSGPARLVEQWAAGGDVEREIALHASYRYGREVIARAVIGNAVWAGALFVGIGAIAGSSGSRLLQYAALGVAGGIAGQLITVHSYVEGALRPARMAIIAGTDIGDLMPRSRVTFAMWSHAAMLAVGFAFAVLGALVGDILQVGNSGPGVAVILGGAMVLVVGPSLWASYSPLLEPIRDLEKGTERVAAGDYGHRLPVVQDDDLGALAASFNRMQTGLKERQRLQVAFGTYVDPGLAARLLAQGDDIFTGERRDVTVLFLDIRDFTPFAEANTAEDTVARLNALFDIVVPVVVGAGGHVNKFLGDGAMIVFGAPDDLIGHADVAVRSALTIQRLVAERFGGDLRIGIGINTGEVIAGTVGCSGHLEFALIGDTVNVAARVEQLTKLTGDSILLTQQVVDSLTAAPVGLLDRGAQGVKGKSTAVRVYGIQRPQESQDRTGWIDSNW